MTHYDATKYEAQRVLVIDNVSESLQQIAKGFRQLNTDVDCVEKPQTVISDVVRTRNGSNPSYTIAVISLELHSMCGYRLQTKITAVDPQIHTVAYTTHSELLYSAAQHGFDSFVLKPVRYPQIRSCLQMILEGRRVRVAGRCGNV